MYQGKHVVALIPARGGSKGLPRKNLLPLGGKPLIAWTIEAANKAPEIDHVVVSTDSEEIADIARKYGADVPFLRPAALATDRANSIDVVLHTLDQLEAQGESIGYIILLQPTSPLRTQDDIRRGFAVFDQGDFVQAVVSVTTPAHHPLWTNTLPENGWMGEFIRPEIFDKNRQELPLYYKLNGAIYIATAHYFRQEKTFIGDGTYALVMDKERSVDIDSKMDFMIAEQLLRSDFDS